ncbi:MAG: DNA-processing protein DprA [Clostridia bacterium]|nr:DNA-processing protein DprA [Clostridia bacterium]
MNELVYWIWLSLACTPDTCTFRDLMQCFDTAEEVYNASDRELRASINPKTSDCSALYLKDLTRAKEIYAFCKERGVGILTYRDERFPNHLRMISTPPVLLYYRGNVPNFDKLFTCSIVGTRKLSTYGRKNAFMLGYDMARAGAVVASGMAVGIDGVALSGALAAGGTVVVFLGCGIDICYPEAHLTLAREIVKRGCIFTEYPPSTPPNRFNFPRRNRLISGISSATVVVEGGEKSGSLITARHAMKQERAVYAFPGNVNSEGAQASLLLIKEGAKLCTGAEDIVRDFEFRSVGLLNPVKLTERAPVDMVEALTRYSVSCVAVDDEIFKPTPKRRTRKDGETHKATEEVQVKSQPMPAEDKQKSVEGTSLPGFDVDQMTIYKAIPVEEECTIESLVSEKYDIKRVMKLLLKLQMMNFVILLPGDKVKRNLR